MGERGRATWSCGSVSLSPVWVNHESATLTVSGALVPSAMVGEERIFALPSVSSIAMSEKLHTISMPEVANPFLHKRQGHHIPSDQRAKLHWGLYENHQYIS